MGRGGGSSRRKHVMNLHSLVFYHAYDGDDHSDKFKMSFFPNEPSGLREDDYLCWIGVCFDSQAASLEDHLGQWSTVGLYPVPASKFTILLTCLFIHAMYRARPLQGFVRWLQRDASRLRYHPFTARQKYRSLLEWMRREV